LSILKKQTILGKIIFEERRTIDKIDFALYYVDMRLKTILGKEKPVNIKDVAELAGVSPATVSRVINNRTWVKEETRIKVSKAIESLGYVPNNSARNLSRMKTDIIGVIIANPHDSLYTDITFSEIIKGIGEIIDQEGYGLLLSKCNGRYINFKSLPNMVNKRFIDGLILGGYPIEDRYIKALCSQISPLVVIGRYLREGEIYRILIDNVGGGFKATEHLINLRYKRIGIIIGPRSIYAFEDKLKGYKKAIEDYGMSIDDSLIIEEQNYRGEGGYMGMKRILSLSPIPDAVFVGDLLMALGAVKCVREYGLRIPDDIAIVGYCDNEIARLTDVPLTTININERNIGHAAARLMLDIITEKVTSPIDITISTELVIRDSCGSKRKGGDKNQLL